MICTVHRSFTSDVVSGRKSDLVGICGEGGKQKEKRKFLGKTSF